MNIHDLQAGKRLLHAGLISLSLVYIITSFLGTRFLTKVYILKVGVGPLIDIGQLVYLVWPKSCNCIWDIDELSDS